MRARPNAAPTQQAESVFEINPIGITVADAKALERDLHSQATLA